MKISVDGIIFEFDSSMLCTKCGERIDMPEAIIELLMQNPEPAMQAIKTGAACIAKVAGIASSIGEKVMGCLEAIAPFFNTRGFADQTLASKANKAGYQCLQCKSMWEEANNGSLEHFPKITHWKPISKFRMEISQELESIYQTLGGLGNTLKQLVHVEQQLLHIQADSVTQKKVTIKDPAAYEDLIMEEVDFWQDITAFEKDLAAQETEKTAMLLEISTFTAHKHWDPIAVYAIIAEARTVPSRHIFKLCSELVQLLETLAKIEAGIANFAQQGDTLLEKGEKIPDELSVVADRETLRKSIMRTKEKIVTNIKNQSNTARVNTTTHTSNTIEGSTNQLN